MEVLFPYDAGVVEFNVCVELLVCRLKVFGVILPSFKHGFRAKVGQVWVVDLCISETRIVQDFELGLVGFGQVCKVLVVVRVDTFEVGFLWPVAEMVPEGRDKESAGSLPTFFMT